MGVLTSKKAHNWVDRGASALPTMQKLLAHFFNTPDDELSEAMHQHAMAIEAMVAADATEVHIAAYLRRAVEERGEEEQPYPQRRVTAIALWHIAKAAQVRDLAERVLRGEIARPAATAAPLGEWLAERLLTPEELAEHKRLKAPGPDA